MKDTFPIYNIGHFINQAENPIGFEILRFDTMAEPDVDDIHKHHFYEILWIEEGQSIQHIDFKAYELGPNSLFFISPGQVHQFEEWQTLSGGTILFTAEYFLMNTTQVNKLFELSFLDNLYANPSIVLQADSFREIHHTIALLIQEHTRIDSSPTIKQSLLHVLLGQIQRCVEKQNKPSYSKRYLVLMKRFKNLLENHFSEPKSVSDYAQMLSITQHHLNHVCKSVAGRTATNIIQERRILEAKRLLVFSGLSVSEIAFGLNFTDSSYFAKAFKAHTGMSPTTFKNEMSEKYRTPPASL